MDVLVVDDNALMQEVIRRFLSGLGYRPHVASRGAEALELARAVVVKLMLIDMYLPEGTGVELLQALRTLPGYATVPAICMSGMNELDAQQMVSADFSEYISKPVDLETLETAIHRYLAVPPT